MEGVGMSRLLMMAMTLLFVCWTTTSEKFEGDPAPSPTPATFPAINTKFYRCGEGCARKCTRLAAETEGSYNQLTNCTVGCMEPCVRSVVDLVYNCTIDCTQTLTTQFSTSSMTEVEGHMEKCYNNCSEDFHLNLSDSEQKALQKYWNIMKDILS